MAVFLAETGPASSLDLPCPDPSEVEAQLVRLGVGGGPRPDIVVTGDTMRVELRGQEGSTLGSREVEAPASCRERATVAAVLVATWMGVWPQADPGVAAVKPPPAVDSPPKPAVAAAPEPPTRAELALTLLGGYDGSAFAAGLALASRWRLVGPWHGFVGLAATTERETPVGQGRAGYTRPALEAGPSLGLGGGRVRGELGLSGRLGILVLRGKGMPVTHVSARAVPGMAAWLRLVYAGKTLSPFITAGGATWFGSQTVTLDDDPATAKLPRWEVQVGMGILWAISS